MSGELYDHGTGITKNVDEATRLYKLSAAQGDADAQNSLGKTNVLTRRSHRHCNFLFFIFEGDRYMNGIGLTKDEVEAARLYKLAADQGHADAQCNLGKNSCAANLDFR